MSFLKECKHFFISKCCCSSSKQDYQQKIDKTKISNKKKFKLMENNIEIALNKINILEKEVDLLKQNHMDNYRKFSESHDDISKKFEELENKKIDAEFITVNISNEKIKNTSEK